MYRGMYIARDPYSSDLHHLIRENYRQVFFNKGIPGTHLPFHLGRPANEVIVRSPRAPPEVDCLDQTMGDF